MSLARYPKYKDSGVRWLGEVPAHWDLMRLRRCVRLNPSKSEVAAMPRDLEVSFLPMEAVGDDGSLSLERERSIQEVETGYTYFRDGDVAFAKITPCFENGKGALMTGLTHGVGFGTTELTVARPIPGLMSSAFLHWVFRSPNFRSEGEASMYGAGGQKRVPDDFVRELLWAVPPESERERIATFLDRETAKIDALIAEQEKLLALLAEKRQATISHAVTRGLDPNAPMKDSGIPWLGEVPAHWNVLSLRRIARAVETGRTPSSEPPSSDLEDGLSWYTPGDFGSGLDLGESSKRVAFIQVESGEVNTFPPGSILIVSIGATLGKVGISSHVASANQQINAVVLNHSMDARFFAYSLSVKAEMMRFLSNASTIGIMNQSKTKDVQVAVPTNAEQVAIAAYLDTATRKIASLEAEAESAISLLKERRSALISAAVTGKIDVRHAA